MPIVVLAMAIIGLAALVTTIITGSQLAVWLSIGVCIVGLMLLMAGTQPSPRRRGTALRTEVAPFGRHVPDYAMSARPPHDVLIHDDHELERDIVREERVLHPDTGPLERDVSGEEAIENIQHRTYHGWKHDRGTRH